MHKNQQKWKREFAPAERQQDRHRGQEFVCSSLGMKMSLRGGEAPLSPGQDSVLAWSVGTPSKRLINGTYYDGSYLWITI